MYLLDADDDAVARAARRLWRRSATPSSSSAATGLWNVHVHVDDVGAAIEAGIAAGRPYRIRVTHFAEQVARPPPASQAHAAHGSRGSSRSPPARDCPSCSREAGADRDRRALRGGVRRPASCSRPIEPTGAAEVVVLPNDPDSVRVAEAAARTAEEDDGIRVAVIPTEAQVQGLAALAVHEPARSLRRRRRRDDRRPRGTPVTAR